MTQISQLHTTTNKPIVGCALCLRGIGWGCTKIAMHLYGIGDWKLAKHRSKVVSKWMKKFNLPPVKPNENPMAKCAICLRFCGLGYRRISKVIYGASDNHNTVAKWIVRRGVKKSLFAIPSRRSIIASLSGGPKRYQPRPKRHRKSRDERRLKIYLRSKIWQWFKHGLHPKSSAKLTGCSRDDFVAHIQSQFHSGMTLANYGKFWHLDHRKPCSRYDLHDLWQRHLCFHWTNYQPMLAKDNRVKAAKFL